MIMQGRAIVLACVLALGGCAAGPNFTRPTPPPAARYTGDTLRSENASTNDTVQHIALGREIEGNWCVARTREVETALCGLPRLSLCVELLGVVIQSVE
jgi:hypothetical protein